MFRLSLLANLFVAIRLLGSWVRRRGGGFNCRQVLLVAGDCPPAILEFRELAHLRAMFHPGLVSAMAVAKRRRRPRAQRRRLICESSSRKSYQQDCRANCMPESAGSRFHPFILKLVLLKTDSAKVGNLLVFGD